MSFPPLDSLTSGSCLGSGTSGVFDESVGVGETLGRAGAGFWTGGGCCWCGGAVGGAAPLVGAPPLVVALPLVGALLGGAPPSVALGGGRGRGRDGHRRSGVVEGRDRRRLERRVERRRLDRLVAVRRVARDGRRRRRRRRVWLGRQLCRLVCELATLAVHSLRSIYALSQRSLPELCRSIGPD